MNYKTFTEQMDSIVSFDDAIELLEQYVYDLWYVNASLQYDFSRRYFLAFDGDSIAENSPGKIGVYRNYSGGWIHSGIAESEYHHMDEDMHDDIQKIIDACRYTLEHIESMDKEL